MIQLLHPEQFFLPVQIIQIIFFLHIGRAAMVTERDIAAAPHIGDQ
jgi:hypothetical protein